MVEGRTGKSYKNIILGLSTQVITIITMFVIRTFFIKYLGADYLGISALFTNILAIFSLAELGIGQAITFNLYKLIIKDNIQGIKSLMYLYKKLYIGIFLIISIAGLLTMPFINSLVGENNINSNIYIIYLLFVLNSASSYILIYKSTYIIAKQENYIINKVNCVVLLINSIVQIILLVLFKSYIIYLIVQVSTTIIQNLYVSKKADKLYPYLKEKNIVQLNKEERKKIFSNVKILMIYKIGTVSLNSTDNIIMAKLISLISVAKYSNYNLIFGAVNTFISTIFLALTASVGDLNASDDIEKKKEIFNVINFMSFWLYGVCSIILYMVIDKFIIIWIGKEFLLGKVVVLIIVINFYLAGSLFVTYTFRQTMGLFVYGKYRPIISAFLNLIISIFLARKIGVSGVLLGTLITRVSTNWWFDAYIVFKKGFKESPVKYFINYMQHILTIYVAYNIVKLITYNMQGESLIGIICISIVSFCCINIIFISFYHKTNEFKYLKNTLINLIRGLKGEGR